MKINLFNDSDINELYDREYTDNCVIMLFFDAYYNSSVFSNEKNLIHNKNIGSCTALGFNPVSFRNYSPTSWCERWNVPQVVAVSVLTY